MARAALPDVDNLRQFANNSHFHSFEQEIEEALFREVDDRKQKLEEARRLREKKARRKRLKKQAAISG